MHLNPSDKDRIGRDRFTVVKEPPGPDVPGQQDPAVAARVSAMLLDIEAGGIDAVRRWSADLDGYTGPLEISPAEVRQLTADLPADLRASLDVGAERTQRFARAQREHLVDLEVEMEPGLVCGHRYVPVGTVGAYLPAGRFPLLASAFMSVGVARAAGVANVVTCTPPSDHGAPHAAVLYSAAVSGATSFFALGGVQALAAMAFGLLDGSPADMIVGAGNAYVAEAKRQLYGRVGIDLLAGPSEVAVIADDTADVVMVAADLLGQAEHGPTSPACLVTTSERVAAAVQAEIERQLGGLATADIAGPAWRDFGSVYLARDDEAAAAVMDTLAPEHLEILSTDADVLDRYHARLRNYGSLFLGPWSTVAYSDKGMSGTNHTLPTARGARYTAGLSVGRFLKPLTYQRATAGSTHAQAHDVVTIADFEQMPAHRDSAQLRLDLVAESGDPDASAEPEPLVGVRH